MVLLALPPADHLLIERDRGQFVPSRRRCMMANVRAERLLKIPAEPSPELLIPGAAAQTRVVSMAGIRLDPPKSTRLFKGIICDDISEFESHMPSQAVGSLPTNRMSLKTARHRVPALRGSATDGACHGRSFKSSFATRSPRSLEQVKRSCNIKAFASAASAASVRLMAASRRTTEAPPWPSSRRGRISERPYGCRPRPLVLWFAYILSGTMRLEQVDANKRCASN